VPLRIFSSKEMTSIIFFLISTEQLLKINRRIPSAGEIKLKKDDLTLKKLNSERLRK
jgi:hypothetical protein